MERLQAHQTLFSRLVTANVGIANPEHPLVRAFASVPRERFVGRGPSQVFTAGGYIETPSDDPALIYQDVVTALDREKQLNNGRPLLHAASLSALGVKPGNTVIHIGAGTGYYTALLATLTGDQGKVLAYEVEPELAARAMANLRESGKVVTRWNPPRALYRKMSNVTVVAGSASEGALPACDAIYVNAAATGPLDSWLDSVNPSGRLIFPLTPADVAGRPAPGMMLLVSRVADQAFDAQFVCQVAFTPCIVARNPETAAKLTAAFARGDARNLWSLRRNETPDETCWCGGQGWWLSTLPLPALA